MAINTGYLQFTASPHTHSVHCSNSFFTYATISYDYASLHPTDGTSRARFTPYSTSWSRFIDLITPESIAYASEEE